MHLLQADTKRVQVTSSQNSDVFWELPAARQAGADRMLNSHCQVFSRPGLWQSSGRVGSRKWQKTGKRLLQNPRETSTYSHSRHLAVQTVLFTAEPAGWGTVLSACLQAADQLSSSIAVLSPTQSPSFPNCCTSMSSTGRCSWQLEVPAGQTTATSGTSGPTPAGYTRTREALLACSRQPFCSSMSCQRTPASWPSPFPPCPLLRSLQIVSFTYAWIARTTKS